MDEGKTIDEIVFFVKNEDAKTSQYDLRETWFNHYGYNLMRQGKKEEAVKIFKLNTELYPNAYNTFDSYGECLLDIGDKEKAIAAYKKSLELNPENKNAEKVLSEIK
ncbi:MAG: tetratricopeptide repeat protein [bacterium]|nr:tetratricopeptide repeat protein [bacterium]